MYEEIIKKYRVEVKARLVRCPRCSGYVTVEPDVAAGGDWAVCVNCGWEQEVKIEEPATAKS